MSFMYGLQKGGRREMKEKKWKSGWVSCIPVLTCICNMCSNLTNKPWLRLPPI